MSKKNLSIREKILFIAFSLIIPLPIVFAFVSNEILSESYEEIEQQEVLEDISRAYDSLENTLSQLNVKLSDWAAWDDTYKFVQDKNEAYIESNLSIPSIELLKINAMLFFNKDGDLVFERVIDISSEEEMDLTSVGDYIGSHKELVTHASVDSVIDGIISLPEGVFFFASQPVLTSQREGPIGGAIVFGRFLDAELIESIGKLAHLSLSVYPYQSQSSPQDVLDAEQAILSGDKNVITPLSDDLIAGYRVFYDFYGKPALTLKVDVLRHIYDQARLTAYLFITTTTAAVFILGFILILLLNRLVIARFFRLSKSVRKIGETRDLSLRLEEGSHDEIGQLASDINTMIEQIAIAEQSKNKLAEEAYGVDEELRRRFEEIEQMNKLMVDRELKMVELKNENERLRKGLK